MCLCVCTPLWLSPRDRQDLAGWVTHRILSGPEAGARVGVGEPWELLGPGSGPGSGSRPDGGLIPHTAS